MLHTTNPVIEHKTGLLNLAEKLNNVSKACKISRQYGAHLTLTEYMGHGKSDVLPVAVGQDVLLCCNPLFGGFEAAMQL